MTLSVDLPHGELVHLIDGKTLTPNDGGFRDIFNPSTGEVCAQVPCGTEAEAELAVEAARRSFEDGRWSDMPPSARKAILLNFADLVENHAGSLDRVDAHEMGKPVSQPFCNARSAATMLRFCAESIDKLAGDLFTSDKTSFAAQSLVPRGVVAAITPWNFPTYNSLLKLAPALAAGNSIVLKPSELSPSTAVIVTKLAHEAGIPSGVVNLVLGLGSTVGRALALHPQVDMVTFTGSTEIGKQMLQYSGQSNMKVVMAECGGKSPHIVFGDGVDLDATAQFIAGMLATNQGQLCSVGSRLLVERRVHDVLVDKISHHLAQVTIGAAIDPATSFGPLVSSRQLDRVLGYIEAGRDEGATLAFGGQRTKLSSGGFFIEPTIFTNVDPGARIAREEIFGPVLSVTPFDHEAEAVRLANGTDYGLVAFVWTASLGTGMRMARAIRSSVLVNGAAPAGEGAGHALSSEPYGQSGIGIESGLAGIQSYMRRHTMWFNHG